MAVATRQYFIWCKNFQVQFWYCKCLDHLVTGLGVQQRYYIKESHVAEFKQWIQDMICCLSLKSLCSKKWGRGHIVILHETDFSLMFELILYKPVFALIICITLVALATFNLFNHPHIFSSFFFTVLSQFNLDFFLL